MNIDTRYKLEQMLRVHEGVKHKMYLDSKGIETIGIGHNLRDVPISDEAVSLIFQTDLENAIEEVERMFRWYTKLDDVRKAAIIDMIFNMGLPTFLTFKKTIDYLDEGDYESASAEILVGSGPGGKSRYYADVGRRAETISQMLMTGEWQDA